MKIIGLIGGMSWESSMIYYQLINQRANALLGGFHSCRCIMISVDFSEIERLQHENNWSELDRIMGDAARRLEAAGAELLILCTNTMHLCSDAIRKNSSIPFLHIAEATAQEIIKKKITKVGLLGTRFTMEKDFYKQVLEAHGIEVLIPKEPERKEIHRIIYKELVHGQIREASKLIYQQIIKQLEMAGAEGVILGCTEIPLLITASDVEIPVFDTTRIHAERAVDWAVEIK